MRLFLLVCVVFAALVFFTANTALEWRNDQEIREIHEEFVYAINPFTGKDGLAHSLNRLEVRLEEVGFTHERFPTQHGELDRLQERARMLADGDSEESTADLRASVRWWGYEPFWGEYTSGLEVVLYGTVTLVFGLLSLWYFQPSIGRGYNRYGRPRRWPTFTVN